MMRRGIKEESAYPAWLAGFTTNTMTHHIKQVYKLGVDCDKEELHFALRLITS